MIKHQRIRLSARKGLALPMALGSIVLIGMILAGMLFAAMQENRIGRNTITQERAFRGAEFGLNKAYSSWSTLGVNGLANGVTVSIADDSSLTPTGVTTNGRFKWLDTVRITRLNTQSYMVVSTGYAGTGLSQARHRTGAVFRIGYPTIDALAALTIHGSLKLGGSSFIEGQDTPPAGWNCPPPGAQVPGVATDSMSEINLTGCNGFKCVDGNPDVKLTNAVDDSNTFFNYGNNINWQTLTAAANIKLTPATASHSYAPSYNADGSCNTNDPSNLGDPNRATPAGKCENYFPVIYVSDTTGLTHITGGVGQGILLVDGDLMVDGGFQFYGVVITRGHLTTQGTGGHFTGSVMSADVDLETNTVLGNAVITYSSCAMSLATIGAGVIKRLNQRAWTEMW